MNGNWRITTTGFFFIVTITGAFNPLIRHLRCGCRPSPLKVQFHRLSSLPPMAALRGIEPRASGLKALAEPSRAVQLNHLRITFETARRSPNRALPHMTHVIRQMTFMSLVFDRNTPLAEANSAYPVKTNMIARNSACPITSKGHPPEQDREPRTGLPPPAPRTKEARSRYSPARRRHTRPRPSGTSPRHSSE